ncbi:MAG TPA: VWA domain-containing protein [Acidobacteriaceae bacterium]|nr:VWA domain-containing protein [Acidobacteriaceae bacterium]
MRRWLSVRLARWVFVYFLASAPGLGHAQQIPTLRTRTNLVLVPTLVEAKTGEPVFNLTAKDFLVTDNGVEQKIHLDTETYAQPISIVVLLQVGRSAVREFYKYQGLPTMIDALAGNTQHRVAVVEFDSRPRMLLDFTSNPDAIQQAIYGIQPGDDGAAILDSVWYAVDMLKDEPPQNQRVIVLLSETRDSGSVTPMKEVIRKIGESDVIVYSLAFSPGREDALEFSAPEGNGFQLLPALKMAIAALKKNTAAAIPHMTGGQYLRFNSGKQLDRQIAMLANQVHNRYMITFRPSDQSPGMHVLDVKLRQPLQVRVLARTSYWATSPAAVLEATPAPGSH